MVHRVAWSVVVVVGLAAGGSAVSGQERANRLIALLEAGKPAIGVWTSATSSPRIAKVLATSDADYIVADIEHEVYDFPALRGFLLGVQDFSLRFRTEPRPAPVVLVKLAHRAGWDPRYEIAESLKVGPAMGVWIPFVESRADLERAISAVRNAETSALGGLNIARDRRDVWPLNPKGELLVVAMIESDEGVRHAQEIVETPGLSAVEMRAHSRRRRRPHSGDVRGRARWSRPPTPRRPTSRSKLAAGYRMLSVGWDYAMLQRSLADSVKALRQC